MPRYQIAQRVSGALIGVYEGADQNEALDAMARDAGYRDYDDLLSVTGETRDTATLDITPAPDSTSGEFSVCQFFENGQYEYVRRFVSAQEAAKTFRDYVTCVGAQIGTTVRVIVTDGGDCTNMEWEYGKGIVFPPPEELNK